MQVYSWLIPVLVFLAVVMFVLLILGMSSGHNEKKLRERMRRINQKDKKELPQSLLREQYLRKLTPLERLLESLPGMEHVEKLCEQSGHHIPAYRVVMLSIVLAILAALMLLVFGRPLLAFLAFVCVLPLPIVKLMKDRDERMEKFEEQLPDALDVMSRALRAGNPFSGTLQVVSEEMDDPIATEFGITFSDLNYGVNVKSSFLALLQRVPSVSLSAMVTAVMVQRETGGNMAEIMDRIASILRQRHRFRRRVRTLTAEGRMSAWILILMPFMLSLLLTVVSPDYLPMLTEDPFGIKLICIALVVMTFGVWWIRRIIQIKY